MKKCSLGMLWDKKISVRLEGKFYTIFIRPTMLYSIWTQAVKGKMFIRWSTENEDVRSDMWPITNENIEYILTTAGDNY